jgi:hypothetical protein
LVQDYKHKSLLSLIRRIIDVPVGYSKEDLLTFRSIASKQHPALVPIMDEYLRLAERADTEIVPEGSRPKSKATKGDISRNGTPCPQSVQPFVRLVY